MPKPLCVDLYCGLGGWAEGCLAEGYDVIGFDIERRPYPAQLVLQDVLTLHGSQLKDAALIVASPPCQRYSYFAMPWTRAKQMAAEIRASQIRWSELNALFMACFRIQREASDAAGRYIPMVVENVKGAQKWVGPAKWHYGSYYLWADVPALMPWASGRKGASPVGNGKPKGTGATSWFFSQRADPRDMRRNEDGEFTRFGLKFGGGRWHDTTNNLIRKCSSRSAARKAASAAIAKIPEPLARHVARVYKPKGDYSWPN